MKNKKIIIGIIATVIVVAIAIAGVFLLNGKDVNNGKNNNTNDVLNGPTKSNETSYLVISINPKLMLHLDKDGKVIEVFQLNDDAGIFTNADFKGLDLESAINKVVDIAKDNGYLKDNKDISVSTLDNDKKDYLDEVIKQLENKGMTVKKEVISKSEKKDIENTIDNYVEIDITVTTEKEVTVDEKITFTKRNVNEINMAKGTTKISQVGVDGIKQITYKVTYDYTGKEISRTKVSETISKKMVEQITKIGVSDYNLNENYEWQSDGKSGYFISESCWKNPIYADGSGGFDYYNHGNVCYVNGNVKTGEKGWTCVTHSNNNWSCYYVVVSKNNKVVLPMPSNFWSTVDKLTAQYRLFPADYGNYDDKNPLNETTCTRFNLSCGRW